MEHTVSAPAEGMVAKLPATAAAAALAGQSEE
jgi:hypothetical protein